jgi:hypothetical protein
MKKSVYSVAIVGLHEYPILVIPILIVANFMDLYYLLKYQPFEDQVQNILAVLTDIVYIMFDIVFEYIIVMEEMFPQF